MEHCYSIYSMNTFKLKNMKREKEGDLTQSYDKNSYTNIKFENWWTTQNRHQKLADRL